MRHIKYSPRELEEMKVVMIAAAIDKLRAVQGLPEAPSISKYNKARILARYEKEFEQYDAFVSQQASKPNGGPKVAQEHLEFLDNLRASGETNMFGAAPYLEDQFKLSKKDAREVLAHWMKTFGERHPQQKQTATQEENEMATKAAAAKKTGKGVTPKAPTKKAETQAPAPEVAEKVVVTSTIAPAEALDAMAQVLWTEDIRPNTAEMSEEDIMTELVDNVGLLELKDKGSFDEPTWAYLNSLRKEPLVDGLAVKPPKEKKAKKGGGEARTQFGHLVSAISGKIDLELMKGGKLEEIATAVGTDVGRVKSHMKHLEKDKEVKISETDGVLKVA